MKNISCAQKLEIINLYNNYKQTREISDCYGIPIRNLAYWLRKQPEVKWRGKRSFNLNEYYFSNINTDNKAYVIGFISADGNIYTNKNRHILRVELQNGDIDILNKIAKEIEYNGKIRTYSKKIQSKRGSGMYSRINVESSVMTDNLIGYGVGPRKTYNLKLPTCINDNNLRHFIRGFFDGDGCLYFNERKQNGHKPCKRCGVNIICAAGFAEDLRELIKKHTGINFRIINFPNCKYVSRLDIESFVDVMNFLNWIYKDADIKMNRKWYKYLEFKNFFYQKYITEKRYFQNEKGYFQLINNSD